ncbi:hypothetical protein HN935_02475 [archaeon]|jgi:glucan phosphoethanolaminetransferase (alkaline phosphatase superfamily)|nr:hypothetical protein [archaeon]
MVKKKEACSVNGGACPCGGLMAIVIIVLVWISTAMWSKIVITIAAALILLSAGASSCGKKK